MVNKLFLGLIVFSYVNCAQSAIISEWNLTGEPGNSSFVAATNSAVNIIGMNLTRGSGLTPRTTTNSFNSGSWHNADPDEYLSFGFSVADGFAVDLTELAIALRSSNSGPGFLGLFYSGDNFSNSLATFTQSGDSVNEQLVDLSVLNGLMGNIEFRIQVTDNTSASGGTIGSLGTLRIDEPAGSNMLFNGTITAVPEPQSYVMFLAGLGLLGWASRRYV